MRLVAHAYLGDLSFYQPRTIDEHITHMLGALPLLAMRLSVCLSVCLTVCLTVCLSVCLYENPPPPLSLSFDPFQRGSPLF